MAPTLTRKQRLQWLRMRSPSLFRSTILMWLLNAFGTVLGIILLLLALLFALNAAIGQQILHWVADYTPPDKQSAGFEPPDLSRINWMLFAATAITGILCLVIARLSRKVNRRSWHIAELEMVADEEEDEPAGEEKLWG